MLTVTIVKVEAGYKIEPASQVAENLEEAHQWVRANFQVTPEEWSKFEQELETSGKTSIETSAGKFEQVS